MRYTNRAETVDITPRHSLIDVSTEGRRELVARVAFLLWRAVHNIFLTPSLVIFYLVNYPVELSDLSN